MTRNIYVGADIQRPLRAVAGKTGAEALVALGNANHELLEVVEQTDFRVRSRLLAREIARTKPDLVGLQEVALYRSGPLELDKLGLPNATEVDIDFLKVLLKALARKGAYYWPAAVQVGSDVEAPSFTGSPFDGTIADAQDARLTVRDVVLKRVFSRVKVTDSGGGQYQARLNIDLAGLSQSFVRGYSWVDARAGKFRFRFLNTHLEAFSSDLALAQAQELLAGPAAVSKPTILVCDCNSDPLNSSVKPTDPGGTPHNGPYNFIVGSGFDDEWLDWAPAEEGWTSGLSELVNDPTPAGFDHRIDMIFSRTSKPGGLKVKWGTVTGDELRDRDPVTGLWPSDHAGVVLKLRPSR
jgi:endonuclease/exonuclease/phosphatase family metal-dependent hydrolase